MKRRAAIAIVVILICVYAVRRHFEQQVMAPFVGVWTFREQGQRGNRSPMYLILNADGRWSSPWGSTLEDLGKAKDRPRFHRENSDGSWTASSGSIVCQWNRPSLRRCGDLLVNAPISLIEELVAPDYFQWDITWTSSNSFEAVQRNWPTPGGLRYLVSKVSSDLETFAVPVE